MKKNNFSINISDLMQILGLVVLGIGIFFGMNYYFLGNLMFSISLTIGFLLLIYGVVNIISKLKRADKDQKLKKTAEFIILFIGYGLLMIISFFPYSHFFNLEFNEKNKLKDSFKDEANKIVNIYEKYKVYVSDDIIDPYRLELTTAWNEGNGSEYGLNKPEDIELMVNSQQSIFYPGEDNNASIENKIEDANNWSSFFHNEIDAWNPFTIINSLQSIPNKIKSNLDYINTLGNRKDGKPSTLKERSPFDYDFDEKKSLSQIDNKFTDYTIENVNWVLIIPTFLLLHFLILLPYFGTKRHRFNPVSKVSDDDMKGILIK